MAVSTQVIRFTKETTGVTNVTQDVSLNFTPKAIIVYSDCNTADNTASEHYQWSQGFSDGTTSNCVTITSDDGDAAADTQTIHSGDSVYVRMSETSNATVLERATCAFITNGVRFTWDVASTTATRICMWAVGGDDITNAKVGNTQVNRTGTGTVDYTGLGFNPVEGKSVLFTLGSFFSATDNTTDVNASSHFGCAVSASKEWCVANVMENARDPSDTWRVTYNNRTIVNLGATTGAEDWAAEFSAWITDGFRLNYTNGPESSTYLFSYLVINGGTWDAGITADGPSTPTNDVDYTVSVNSQPLRGLMLAGTLYANTHMNTIHDTAMVGIGATDGTNQSCICNIDEAAQPTTDSYRVNNAVNIVRFLDYDAVGVTTATFDSFGTNSFRLDFSAADSVSQHAFCYVVVADNTPTPTFVTKVVNVASTSGTQDITFTPASGDFDWTPKVAIVQWSYPNTVVDAYANGVGRGYGFTDGTNQRCIAMVSEDATAASDTAASQFNDALIVGHNQTGTITTIDAQAAFSSWLTNGMRITWSNAPTAAFQIQVTFLGGDDITNATVGTLMTTTGATCSATGLSYQPDFGMFLFRNIATEGSGSSTTPQQCIGFAKDASNQWCQSWSHADAAATSAARTIFSHDRVVLQHTTSITGYSAFSTWNSDGFTLNNTDTYAVSLPIYYLVMKGGQYAVGNSTEPAGTGTQTITTNKDTKVVGVFGLDIPTANTVTASGMWCSGFTDWELVQAVMVQDEVPASDPMANASAISTAEIYLNITGNATPANSIRDDSAAISAMSSTGFALNWTNIGQARPYRYVTFGPAIPLESISNTKTHKYNIIGKITVNKTDKYNIIGKVSGQYTHKFYILSKASQSKTHKWNILKLVTRDKTHVYNVIKQVLSTKTHLFNILYSVLVPSKTHKYNIAGAVVPVSTTKTHKYNVITEVTVSKTHKYNVIAKVTTSKTHKYNVLLALSQVSTTKTHKYTVTIAVTTTKTHLFGILNRIDTIKTHQYSILNKVETSKTHLFSLINTVTTSKTHKFNVLEAQAQVVATKTHIFSIAGVVTTSKTHKWNTIVTLSVSKTHKFSILNKITPSKTHIYTILERIAPSKTHKWNVIERIQFSTAHLYHIEGKVVQSKTHKFSIIEKVTATKTHKYDALEVITPSKTHKWNIIGKIIASRTHKWNYEGVVIASKTHKWNVLEASSQVISSKTHKFSVLTSITSPKTHKFSIVEGILASKTHKFSVIARISRSRIHVFNLLQQISRSRTHKWNVTVEVTPNPTKTHKFHIISSVTSPKTHKFSIIGRITRTHTHRWDSGGKVVVTKRHNYNIGIAYAPPEGGGSSTVVNIRFPPRIQILDIISDIRNKVISNIEIAPFNSKKIICVGVVELNEAIISPIVKVASGKARHRIASTLIIPQIINTIENLAISERIAIEIIEPQQKSLIHTLGSLQLQKPKNLPIFASSQTQIKQDPTRLLRLSATTELIPQRQTRIASIASLELKSLNNIQLKAPEIMSSEKYKILKRLIDILSNNKLFDSGDILLKSPDRIIDPYHEEPNIFKKITNYLGHDNLFESE